MNVLEAYPGIRPLLALAARSRNRQAFTLDLLDDLEFCDRLLRELHSDTQAPEQVRLNVYTALLSTGPGSLLAFGWLVSRGHAGPELILSYLTSLRPGTPRPDALEEFEAMPVAVQLLSALPLSEESQSICAGRLLGSVTISRMARQSIFRNILEGALLSAGCRQALLAWSVGARLPGAYVPDAPEDLYRQGTLARVQAGDPLDMVLKQVLLGLDQRPDPAVAADVALDLLEMGGDALERSLRLQTLDRARLQSEARVRRRAYQLAEPTEGETFLRLGLRDQDFGVRSWVLNRVSRNKTQAV